jgi:hypothetical protein
MGKSREAECVIVIDKCIELLVASMSLKVLGLKHKHHLQVMDENMQAISLAGNSTAGQKMRLLIFGNFLELEEVICKKQCR